MVDDPSGHGDDIDDQRSESSEPEPDDGPMANADLTDSSGIGDEWGASDRVERTETRPREDAETEDSGWDGIPLDLSDSSDADAGGGTQPEDEYAPESNSTPVEPGEPDLENAVFVLLGAIAMLLVLLRLVSIPLG
ncbi:DUF7312 domain-containing protein [Natrinema halophilum]|uniref:DUF7312 domain-containing protein n=1 Tax=Natrinema halophilum TaxID=1699371 RepID=A0A7D5GUQ7_9EURY|nr:hypothetical protein [Natrinema halophilum]QLG50869.1 hypothetical protein HYG82_19525 [Natrinema halophilum]